MKSVVRLRNGRIIEGRVKEREEPGTLEDANSSGVWEPGVSRP